MNLESTCIRCHRETRYWGRDSFGLNLSMPDEDLGESVGYNNPTFSICYDCAPKVSMFDMLIENRLHRRYFESKYPVLRGLEGWVPPRLCCNCHGQLSIDWLICWIYEYTCGPLLDYCGRCFRKATAQSVLKTWRAVYPQWVKECEEYRKQNHSEEYGFPQ